MVSLIDHPLGLKSSVIIKFESACPDSEGSHHVFLGVGHLDVPDLSDCLGLGSIELPIFVLGVAPGVDSLGQKMLPSEVVNQRIYLNKVLNWLESLLVPLFDANSEFILAKTLQDLDEPLQCAVALTVKLTVRKELVHGHGFATSDCAIQELE